MSEHIYRTNFLYLNANGSKKSKEGKKDKNSGFFAFFALFAFFASSLLWSHLFFNDR
jgi:hypothetical protein